MVTLYRIYDERIGHLASNTDLFLRRIQLKTVKIKGLCLALASTEPCNEQLLKMFKRSFPFPILQLPMRKIIVRIMDSWLFPFSDLSPFHKKSILSKFISIQHPPFKPNAYYEFNNTKPPLYFTDSEEEKGKKLLKKMGIGDNSWFVCFHSRDPVYLSKLKLYKPRDMSYHDFRDCDIKNYIEAAEYIASKGGFAVRMGYHVAEKLPDLNNSRIIDYASYYRTDFGDIYLPAKCKFFLGSTTGMLTVSTLFNVPTVWANLLPFDYTPFRKGDMYIPKKIWSKGEKRFLTFREILESGAGDYLYSEQYAKAGLKVVENTAEEILDLTKEMNERLNGTFETTEADEDLQNSFHSLFKSHHRSYGTPARVGTKFLRENKELLE